MLARQSSIWTIQNTRRRKTRCQRQLGILMKISKKELLCMIQNMEKHIIEAARKAQSHHMVDILMEHKDAVNHQAFIDAARHCLSLLRRRRQLKELLND